MQLHIQCLSFVCIPANVINKARIETNAGLPEIMGQMRNLSKLDPTPFLVC
jgi:hypothetical protein